MGSLDKKESQIASDLNSSEMGRYGVRLYLTYFKSIGARWIMLGYSAQCMARRSKGSGIP
jgi:hypothetical protein